MKPQRILLSAMLLTVNATALADAGGTLYHNGTPIALTSGYAYVSTDHFDKSKQVLEIALSDVPIDAATIDAGKDRRDDLSRYLDRRKANSVNLTLDPNDKDQPLKQVGIAMDAYHSSGVMGGSFYTLDIKRNDGKRIEGTFRSTHEQDKTSKNDEYYDLHFALDIASGPPFGPGLPADGGEPFKAYEAYGKTLFDAAFHDRYDGLSEVMSQAQIKALIAVQKKDPKSLKKVVEKMRGDNMNYDVAFMQGRIKGDVATLDIKGAYVVSEYDADSNMIEKRTDATATVTMKKEDGAWRFDNQAVKRSDKTVTTKP